MSNSVYAYDQQINDFRMFSSEQDWKVQLDVSGAACYLTEHLKKSLSNDFFPAYDAYKVTMVAGYFALPRIVFPYITFLGTLFKGSDSAHNAVDYMNTYLSKINQLYVQRDLCDFIYRVYRHGLEHTNMPKVVADSGKVVGWRITYDDRQHLNIDNYPGIVGKDAIFSISPKILADEVVSSIDEFIKDLHTGVASLQTFKKGFLSMSTTSHRFTVPQYLR